MSVAPDRQQRAANKTMPLGEDILLARHGDRIIQLRQDRKHDLTIARLHDGHTDWAANTLAGMSERIPESPAMWMGRLADDFKADKLPMPSGEVRFLAKLGVIWGGLSLVLSTGILWLTYQSANPELMHSMMGVAGS